MTITYRAQRFNFAREIALADTSGDLWVQILAAGSWKHPAYGDLEITADDLREIKRNFDAGARQFVYADFDHGIARRADGSGNAISAGEVKALELRNNDSELWALYEPTRRARERIAAREYRYTSADFDTAYRDKRTGNLWGKVLRGFALTNVPFIEGMQPLALGDATRETQVVMLAEFTASPDGNAGGERLMPKLAETLGLPSDATDEQIEAKVKQLSEGLTKAAGELEEVREALHLSEDADLVKEAKRLADERRTLAAKDRERDADALLEKAVREGRITPAARAEWRAALLDENEAVAKKSRDLLEKMPRVIPLAERKAEPGKAPETKDREKLLDEKIKAKQKEDPKLSYKDALILAERELDEEQSAVVEE